MPVELSESQINEFKEAFKKFDINGDNTISLSELKNVMDSLSIETTDHELKDIITQYDVNNNGRLEFPEFLKLIKEIMDAMLDD